MADVASGETAAIILSRGGSKGIPRKNLVSIGGRPLIEHTLERACSDKAVSRVFLSTDSSEIADTGRPFGVEIVWRPAKLCDDSATSESGLVHALQHMQSKGLEPRLIVFLQPTSPLRSATHITEALSLLESKRADSLFSAGPLRGLAWKVENDEKVVPVSYDPQHRMRRQDAPEYLAENGSIYVFRPWVLKELGCRLGGRIVPFRMDSQDSFEVDEVGDIPIVDFLLRRRYPELVRDSEA